jgi:inner membrane protein
MEPVTHLLTGACISRAGFNRKTAYATAALVLAAEAPDIDMLWEVRGPVAALQHHRGLTHTLVAAPVMALAVVAVFWLWHQWRGKPGKAGLAPRWGWLWLGAFVADLSHLLLDFTNNYGLRPFFPFDKHWYAWSIVSIFDPYIFAALLAALLIPALLKLTDQEIGDRRPRSRTTMICRCPCRAWRPSRACSMLLRGRGCWKPARPIAWRGCRRSGTRSRWRVRRCISRPGRR